MMGINHADGFLDDPGQHGAMLGRPGLTPVLMTSSYCPAQYSAALGPGVTDTCTRGFKGASGALEPCCQTASTPKKQASTGDLQVSI